MDSKKERDWSFILREFCEIAEKKIAEEPDKELRSVLTSELKTMRDTFDEARKFVEEYPNLAGLMSSVINVISEHETKLEMLKDCLVHNDLMIQVEARTEEEAVEMAKKTLEEEMLMRMMKNMDKSTVH